jgi:isocitrate/isopropylmalate dehydrogenase
MRDHRIAAISGDGISTEVIAAGLSVLKALEAQGAKPPTKDLGELPLLG